MQTPLHFPDPETASFIVFSDSQTTGLGCKNLQVINILL